MAIERIIPGTVEWDAFYANHIFRYKFALNYLRKGKCSKILDAATGVGYGANFLALNSIESIIAIDRNEKALEIAAENFNNEAIRFLKDDCHTLKEAEKFAPYDAIVSFETLEHLPQPNQFLENCYKLLQPGGVLILSTPNATISSPNGVVNWEYHEKEYTHDELYSLLKEHKFINITIEGQDYSETGEIRNSLRAELNKINSNPFIRLGRWFQRKFRNRYFGAVLPEKETDFKIIPSAELQNSSSFVLMAVAYKD